MPTPLTDASVVGAEEKDVCYFDKVAGLITYADGEFDFEVGDLLQTTLNTDRCSLFNSQGIPVR